MFFELGQAQDYSKRFPLLGTTNGFISSIQIVDDTIYAMAYIGDSLQPLNGIGLFAKYDKSGNLAKRSTFAISGRTNIGVNQNTLIRSKDGGFAYSGWTSGTSPSQNALIIIKYNKSGDFEWYKEFPDTNTTAIFPEEIISCRHATARL